MKNPLKYLLNICWPTCIFLQASMSALDKARKFLEVAMQQELCKMMSSGSQYYLQSNAK